MSDILLVTSVGTSESGDKMHQVKCDGNHNIV